MKFPEYRGGFPTLDQWDAVYDILYRALPEQKPVLDNLMKGPAPVTPKRWTKFVIALFDAIPEESYFIMGIADLFDSFNNYYLPGNATLGITKDMFRGGETGEAPAVPDPDKPKGPPTSDAAAASSEQVEAPTEAKLPAAKPFRIVFRNQPKPCAEIISLAEVTAEVVANDGITGDDARYRIDDVRTRSARFRWATGVCADNSRLEAPPDVA